VRPSEARFAALIIAGAILLLRPLKARLIALQYRHNLLHSPPSA
jgi:uncharacterized protein (DUF983 family)